MNMSVFWLDERPRPTTGHHAHRLHRPRQVARATRAAVAEVVGTFILVLTIVSAVIGASLSKPIAGAPYGSLAVAVAGGLALAVSVAVLGPLSGAHLNPAVTLSLAINRRFPWRYVPAYLAAQLGGAIAAALAAWALFGDRARDVVHLGASFPAAGTGAWQAFGAEAVGTFILVLAISWVTTDRPTSPTLAVVTIGSALAAAILSTGPISGAGLNPARAIGPMIVAGKFTDWWVYVTAPFLGGALAATLYDKVFRTGQAPEPR
jgi:MIP family channel proteins